MNTPDEYVVLIFDDSGRKVEQKSMKTEQLAEEYLKEKIVVDGLDGYIQKLELLTE